MVRSSFFAQSMFIVLHKKKENHITIAFKNKLNALLLEEDSVFLTPQ